MGSRSALPIEPRSAFHPSGSAVAAVVTNAVAPAASAVRMIPPTLPGSCTSWATTTSGFVEAIASASDGTGAARCRRRPRGSAPGSSISSVFRETMNTSAPSATSCSASAFIAGSPNASLFECRAFDRQSRFARLDKQVRPVEQQLAFVSVCWGVASKLAIAFDAGVRRSSHLESITDVLGSSWE